MLVLGGVITFFNGILLAHLPSMFRISVKAGTGPVARLRFNQKSLAGILIA
jgi:hypothetical protein